MDTGIRLSVLWNQTDVFKVHASAWNGQFGGSADVYVGIGALAEAARSLEGFPRSLADRRRLQLGEFGRTTAGGAARMDFYCKDSAGHALVEVQMESDQSGEIPEQTVFLVAAIEPAAVDSFVADMRRLHKKRGNAYLRTSG
jgi:hypothetical protein